MSMTQEEINVRLFDRVKQLETELDDAKQDLEAMDRARQLAHDNTAQVTHALSKLMEAIPNMEAELAASRAEARLWERRYDEQTSTAALTAQERDASKAREDAMAAALEFIRDECDWGVGGDHWNEAGDKRIGPACEKALEGRAEK